MERLLSEIRDIFQKARAYSDGHQTSISRSNSSHSPIPAPDVDLDTRTQRIHHEASAGDPIRVAQSTLARRTSWARLRGKKSQFEQLISDVACLRSELEILALLPTDLEREY